VRTFSLSCSCSSKVDPCLRLEVSIGSTFAGFEGVKHLELAIVQRPELLEAPLEEVLVVRDDQDAALPLVDRLDQDVDRLQTE
jgi:hypothetical protein